jgi:hypothetical protein
MGNFAHSPPPNDRHLGHAHFWERALSRRQFIGATAAAGGAAVTAGLWLPTLAEAANVAPRPIPGGTFLPPFNQSFHFFFPTGPFPETVENKLGDQSTITDFRGSVGVADVGQNTGSDGLLWKADVRFMKGTYVGVDDHRHSGAFAFV